MGTPTHSRSRGKHGEKRDDQEHSLDQPGTEREHEQSNAAHTAYVAAYNILVKSIESMEPRLKTLEGAPSWAGIAVLEKAVDALTPAMNDMYALCNKYVDTVTPVSKMVKAARVGRQEVHRIQAEISRRFAAIAPSS